MCRPFMSADADTSPTRYVPASCSLRSLDAGTGGNKKTNMDIFSILKTPISIIIGGFTSEISHIVQNRILEYSAETYENNKYFKTFLNPGSPQLLLDYYVPLDIEDVGYRQERIYHVGSYEEARINTAVVKSLFSEQNKIVITGRAGGGKTTLIRYLTLASINQSYKIPIIINFRDLTVKGSNFDSNENIIFKHVSQLFYFHGIAKNEGIINRMLSSGQFIIFMDGLDELEKSNRNPVCTDIDAFVERYGKNDFVLTSRPFFGLPDVRYFTKFDLLAFATDDSVNFIEKALGKKSRKTADSLKKIIRDAENSYFKAYFSNPLLLSMFVVSYNYSRQAPENKNTFYRNVYESLLFIHDSTSKLAFVRERHSNLTNSQFTKFLTRLAYALYYRNRFNFTYGDIQQAIKKIDLSILEISSDIDDILYDLVVGISILIKDGNIYSFPHKSMQEYFTARLVADMNSEKREFFYNMIMRKVKVVDNSYISNNINLFSIIEELDEYTFVKFVFLPLINYIIEIIDEKEVDGIKKKMYLVYSLFSMGENYQTIYRPKLKSIAETILAINREDSISDEIKNKLKIQSERAIHEMEIYLNQRTSSEENLLNLLD